MSAKAQTQHAAANTAAPVLFASTPIQPGGRSRWETLKTHIPACRRTVDKLEALGQFPRRQFVGGIATWKNDDILQWLADPAAWSASAAPTVEQSPTKPEKNHKRSAVKLAPAPDARA